MTTCPKCGADELERVARIVVDGGFRDRETDAGEVESVVELDNDSTKARNLVRCRACGYEADDDDT